ncbi:universal stress protein [Afifella pfennigii]|uniref:universal stress protein n=1 Tax=Afifella pfennigii TaxID=209897 RepID=UPI00047B5122|nr:universal stress protein [Afifella pfennigii]
MTEKYLLALDLGDPDSVERIFPVAQKLASNAGAELHVVSVVPTYSMPIVGSFFPADFERKALEAARGELEKVIRSAADNPEAVQGHIAHGLIYEEILRTANDIDADLIIMESHRPALRDYLLGPNAARVVRHARQSVHVHRC